MKSFLLALPVFMIVQFCFGINLDTCPWPLKPGNVWYFEDRDNYYQPTKVSIQDSVLFEGKQYYAASLPLLPFTHFRIDSIGDVYTFCDSRDQLLFPFGTRDTTRTKVKFDNTYAWWIKLRFIQDSAVVVFPGLSGTKVCAILDCDTFAIDDEIEILFVKSAGPKDVFRWMGPGTYRLEGCILNGMQFGTTSIQQDFTDSFIRPMSYRTGLSTLLVLDEHRERAGSIMIYTLQGKRIAQNIQNTSGIFIKIPMHANYGNNEND